MTTYLNSFEFAMSFHQNRIFSKKFEKKWGILKTKICLRHAVNKNKNKVIKRTDMLLVKWENIPCTMWPPLHRKRWRKRCWWHPRVSPCREECQGKWTCCARCTRKRTWAHAWRWWVSRCVSSQSTHQVYGISHTSERVKRTKKHNYMSEVILLLLL